MDMRTYLRDEILEEGEQGFLSEAEVQSRLSRFDDPQAAPGAAGSAPLASVSSGDAPSGLVAEDDPRITVREGRASGGPREVSYYAVSPAGGGVAAGVLVIHENRGLTPHIRDVARRLGVLGYAALAPDLMTPVGGTGSFADSADVIAALGKLQPQDMVADLVTALDELAASPAVDAGRLGVIGFCFGGGMTWRLLTRDSRLKAGVPFYGPNPPLDDVPGIAAAVLGIYGGLDARINAGLPDIERAMSESGKVFEHRVFDGAQHAFHNDTNPDRYHPQAAAGAWEAAVAWLGRYLGDS